MNVDHIKGELDKVIRTLKPDNVFGYGSLYDIATHFYKLKEEKLKHFQVWLEKKEQDFNNEEDEESARIIAGVKSMFEAIFDL